MLINSKGFNCLLQSVRRFSKNAIVALVKYLISAAHDYVILLDAIVAIIIFILFSGRIHLSIMQNHLPALATFFKLAHKGLVTQQHSNQLQAGTLQQQKITNVASLHCTINT